jgi:hypothetical protein
VKLKHFLPVSFILTLSMPEMSVADPNRCKVTDPTGTPLNVRAAPSGPIIGTLQNGTLVSITERSLDRNGKAWVYILRNPDGEPLGWVFREFVSCF